MRGVSWRTAFGRPYVPLEIDAAQVGAFVGEVLAYDVDGDVLSFAIIAGNPSDTINGNQVFAFSIDPGVPGQILIAF